MRILLPHTRLDIKPYITNDYKTVLLTVDEK